MLAPMRRLLLISNSTLHGQGYLDHCAAALVSHFGAGVRRVTFVPYALFDRDAYAAKARARFAALGLELESVHESSTPARAVESAQALFIGGGNTFRLLDLLQRNELVAPIRARVDAGMPYAGTSAGSVVACVTMKTTNDMPIVQPRSFDALALVPFNINAHYQDPIPGSTHMGETREQRIREFHEENSQPVLGLREGAWVEVEGSRARLGGKHGAKLFRRGEAPVDLAAPANLDALLASV